MKKMLIAIVATLLFVCVPALAGAQVLQITTSAENWPTLHSEWKEAGAATEDVVSANAVGVTAYRIAKSRQEPSSEMKQEDYLVAFYQANPELNPVDEWIKLDTFLTLARAGKIQHPSVPAATSTTDSVAEVVAQPVETTSPAATTAAPQESADEVARFTSEAALRASRDAVAIATRTSAEVEKLASRSGVDTVARGRLTALEQQSAALAALPQELSDRQEKAVAEQVAKQEALQQRIDAEITNLKEEVEGRIVVIDSRLSDVAAAPAKADNVARTSAFIALVLASALAFAYLKLNGATKESKETLRKQKLRIDDVETKQAGHDEQFKKISGLLNDPRDVVIPDDLRSKLLGLKQDQKHTAGILVDEDKFNLVFEASVTGSVKIFGIEGQLNAVKIQNVRSVILRAARDGRIVGVKDTGNVSALHQQVKG